MGGEIVIWILFILAINCVFAVCVGIFSNGKFTESFMGITLGLLAIVPFIAANDIPFKYAIIVIVSSVNTCVFILFARIIRRIKTIPGNRLIKYRVKPAQQGDAPEPASPAR